MAKENTIEEINLAAESSWKAFQKYRRLSLKERADFLRAIAKEIEDLGDELLKVAGEETNLPEPRLKVERNRVIFQLTSYANACEQGNWLEARIDTEDASKSPPKPDLRKMLVPLGPVVVFGASNFPFAYSTAGGDTACAFAAGCPAIVKGHPAHIRTSELVAGAILKAAKLTKMPEGIFHHIHGTSFDTGKALVQHDRVKAVGFTGSTTGGLALFNWANERKVPIPVFAEMGSINPVFLLPGKLQESANEQAKNYAASITMSTGQFCTNPGLMIAVDSPALAEFTSELASEIEKIGPATMLHPGIAKAFIQNREKALAQQDVELLAESATDAKDNQGTPTIATVSGKTFLANPVLHQEVFGPYSLLVKCADAAEMLEVATHLEGQLTATLIATDDDIRQNETLVEAVKDLCGRLIQNGVPTGVDVSLSMQHGGPFPATTDSRFTSVGSDGIKRFARPVAYQAFSNELLPPELQNENPLKIWRTVNNELTKDSI